MSQSLARTQQQALASTASDLDALVNAASRRSVLLLDVSDSMNQRIKIGKRRIDALRKVVKELRETHPVPMVVFGYMQAPDQIAVVDNIPEPSGSTPMGAAIGFCGREGANHIVMVTDGEPDRESDALAAAVAFGGVIDTFFVGDPDGRGAAFAKELAEATGGTCNVSDLGKPKELGTKIKGLLGAGTPELPPAAIQLGDGQ